MSAVPVYCSSVKLVFRVHGCSRLGDDLRCSYDEGLGHLYQRGMFNLSKRLGRVPPHQ